jgi:hypothetical protein
MATKISTIRRIIILFIEFFLCWIFMNILKDKKFLSLSVLIFGLNPRENKK